MKNKAVTWDVSRDQSTDHARRDASLASDEDRISAGKAEYVNLREGRATHQPFDGLARIAGFAGIEAERLARLLVVEQRDDPDVRTAVQRALTLDSFVPLSVGAHVQDGIVTLTGAVSRLGDRDDALFLVSRVPGVLGIIDELVLTPAAPEVGG